MDDSSSCQSLLQLQKARQLIPGSKWVMCVCACVYTQCHQVKKVSMFWLRTFIKYLFICSKQKVLILLIWMKYWTLVPTNFTEKRKLGYGSLKDKDSMINLTASSRARDNNGRGGDLAAPWCARNYSQTLCHTAKGGRARILRLQVHCRGGWFWEQTGSRKPDGSGRRELYTQGLESQREASYKPR